MSASSDHDIVCMDTEFYKAAKKGEFELFENCAHPLDHLVTGKNKNTILHLHLNSPNERSKDFIEKALGQCPQLLWQMNNDGDIPLHIAAKKGRHEIVRLLIEEVKKPIHRDLETGEEEAVRRMLRLKNLQHETAFHLSIGRGYGYLEVVKEILQHEDSKYIYLPNKCGESPLYRAVYEGAYSIVVEILNKFESPDCGGPNGRTIFHASVVYDFYSGKLDVLLSEVGSLVNQEDENGWTPLHYAAYLDKFFAVQKILEKDKRSAYATDKERNRTALHMAACQGHVKVIKEIIKKCPECWEITDVRGWNVLHYAAYSGNEKAIKTILKDPSLAYLLFKEDIKGYTPLHLFVTIDYDFSFFSAIKLEDYPYIPRSRSALMHHFLIGESTEKRIQEWMKDLGDDPFGKKIEKLQSWEQRKNEMAEKAIPELEKAKDSHLVAAALVATVTFAAAFTLPGGYISDSNDFGLMGTPILSRNAAFKAFVVTDAIAMVLSTSSVFIHFIMVMLGYKQRYYWLIRSAFWFIVVAMGAMVVAFVTGTYAVLAPNSMELAVSTCIIGLTFFVLVFYASIRLIAGFIKRDKAERRFSSVTDSLGRLADSTPQYLACGCDWRYWCNSGNWFYWCCWCPINIYFLIHALRR